MQENNSAVQPLEKQNFDGGGINFRWFISTILGVWPWFLICIIVSLSLGQLYLRYTTPIYSISADIAINDSKKGGEASMLENLGLPAGRNNIENEVRSLKSRTLMEKVVQDLNLNIRYLVSGRVKTAELYSDHPFDFVIVDSNITAIQRFFSYKIKYKDNAEYVVSDGDKQSTHKWEDTVRLSLGRVVLHNKQENANVEEEFTVNILPVADAADILRARLGVSVPNKQSNMILVSLTDDIPLRGENVVDKLIEEYMVANVEDRNRIADNTIKFIDERLQYVIEELGDVEGEIENFKKQNEITDLGLQSSMLLSKTGEQDKELQGKESELYLVNSLEKYLKENQQGIAGGIIIDDAGVRGIMEQYNGLLLQKEKLGYSVTSNNPIVKNIDEQIAASKSRLIAAIAGKKKALQYDIDKLNQRQNTVSSEIRTVPSKERKFLDYSRQQEIKQQLYLFLLKKREETAISKSSTIPDAKIIDSAKASGWPISPNRSKILYMSFFAGLFLPIAGLYIRKITNNRIISKLDITNQTNIPVLGEIGHYDDDHAVAVKANSKNVLAEQFRSIRTNLQFLLTDKEKKIIMLTSSMSGEGKSFIAINLASTFAISGKKVVLMELDLRKPKISLNLGLDNNVGYSSYAIGKASLDEIIKPSGIHENLSVISSGPIPPNPSELILLQKNDEMYSQLKERFDYIIIDTAPLGLVTDAQLLSKYADTTLYVVRQAYTYKQQIQIPNDLYIDNKIKSLSIIVNDVKLNRGFMYGYGYGYGYNYGYGYGYGNGYGYGYGAYSNGYYLEEETKAKGIKKILKKITK